MGNKRKHKQPLCIFGKVLCVVVSLGYKIAHNWASDPTYYMHDNRGQVTWISREHQPCNMIYCHGKDCNGF